MEMVPRTTDAVGVGASAGGRVGWLVLVVWRPTCVELAVGSGVKPIRSQAANIQVTLRSTFRRDTLRFILAGFRFLLKILSAARWIKIQPPPLQRSSGWLELEHQTSIGRQIRYRPVAIKTALPVHNRRIQVRCLAWAAWQQKRRDPVSPR